MADVSVGMSVTGLAQFKRDIATAQASVKSLGEELKRIDSQFQLTGDKEQYLADKSKLLQMQMNAFQNAAKSANAALDQMRNQNVNPLNKAYQSMQTELSKAQTGMNETALALQNLGKAQQETANGADEVVTKVGNIEKGVAWDNIAEGIGKVTSSLEKGAKAAINFAKKIASAATDSTEWADSVLRRALENGVDAETIQRWDNLADHIGVSVDTIVSAKNNLAKHQDKLPDLLGIDDLSAMSIEDAFWAAGEAILGLSDVWERENAAMEIFGKGWKDLLPLFLMGQEEYTKMMADQDVLSNEQIDTLAKANDAITDIKQEIELMKNQFWADNADKIISLMQWLIDNKGPVVDALVAIGAGFGALKLAEVAANIAKIIDGFQKLGWLKGGGGAGSASGGSMFTTVQGWLNNMGGGLANFATTLATYDASGALALLPQIFGDQFAFGRALRDGGSLGDAFSRGWDEFLNSAEQGLGNFGDYFTKTLPEAFWGMFGINKENMDQAGKNLQIAAEWTLSDEYTAEDIMAMITGESPVPVPIAPEAEDGSAESISEQIGNVPVTVVPVVGGGGFSSGGGNFMAELGLGSFHGHANGIWSVPWDGYLSVLHKGERVVPAREANSNNYSSNLYVESMYMNNGTDADGLAAAMAAAQRRTRAGYGS